MEAEKLKNQVFKVVLDTLYMPTKHIDFMALGVTVILRVT